VVLGALHEGHDGRLVAGIELLGDGGTAVTMDQFDGALGRSLAEIADDDLSPLLRETARRHPADAGPIARPVVGPGAAGANDDDLVLKPSHAAQPLPGVVWIIRPA